MGIYRKTYGLLLSLNTTLWLLGLLCVMFLAGALMMPAMPAYDSMNSMPLMKWMTDGDLSATWWLWASIVMLALLVLNTVFCTFDSILKKSRGRHWALIVSPQVMHLGFLFMLFAHLISSASSSKSQVAVREGSIVKITDALYIKITSLDMDIDSGGFPTHMRADIEFAGDSGILKSGALGPNMPSFYNGFGVYLKDMRPYPAAAALLEVNREPGALWALAGGALFTLGNIALIALRIIREGKASY